VFHQPVSRLYSPVLSEDPPAKTSDLPMPAPIPATQPPSPIPSILERAPPTGDLLPSRSLPDAPVRTADLMLTHDLVAATHTTAAASKLIPILVLVLTTILTLYGVSAFLFSGPVHRQHVSLRFVAAEANQPAFQAPLPGDTPRRLVIETVPPGIFVLYGQDVLGQTPLTTNLNLRFSPDTGVELTSPFFETWIGFLEQDNEETYTMKAELLPKE
jgi:hypothetical protein